MQKAKKNISKINFKRAVTQKFKEYDQKLDELTSIYVSEAINKVIYAKVLIKMKKLIHTHVPKVLANYVKPCLNNFVLEVMQNNQISIFTKPSIFIDDLSDMDLKLKLLNKIHENKSRPKNKKHYDTLYDFILLDQEAEPSFHKRAHDHQDPPTDREGEKRKKRQKVAGESSKFSRKEKAPVDGSRRNRDHILRPSTMAIENLEGVGLEKLNLDYKNDVELEYHVDQLKAAVLSEAQWNNDEGDVTEEKYTTSLTKHYAASCKSYGLVVKRKWGYGFLSSIMVRISDKQEYTFSYADLPRLNLNDIEDMYLLKVQDKMHHLPSDDEKDFNNALLLFIRRTIPYTMTGTEKRVVYLNKYNRRSLMKLNEVYKLCDGTLMKIQENLIEMITKNKLGQGNETLRGRDWNYKDVKRSKEMVDKIDQVMKHREQL
ncbi:hypothetical protein Tco_0216383 [Tanacetum coccineum]